MAIDTSTLEATLQTKFDNVTDPKEMLLLGKAYEATVGGIAVSDIEDAGAAQVATINSVATSTFKTVGGTSILGTGDVLPSQTGNADLVLKTDGSTLSWGQGGGVLQTKSKTWTNQGSYTSTPNYQRYPYSDYVFTPVSTGSWTLVMYRLMGEYADSWNTDVSFRRNGTVVNGAGGSGITSAPVTTYGGGGNNSSTPELIFLTTLDKTGNTAGSAITYDLGVRTTDGSSYTHWYNRCFEGAGGGEEFGISEVIFMEVVAS
jgi:hypothetical protein